MSRAWRKYPDMVLNVARDWTLDLDGATIVGLPAVTTKGGVECVNAGQDGALTKFKLSGGTFAVSASVHILVETSAGEKLSDTIPVIVEAP